MEYETGPRRFASIHWRVNIVLALIAVLLLGAAPFAKAYADRHRIEPIRCREGLSPQMRAAIDQAKKDQVLVTPAEP
jgi:hypothetical protein